MTKQPSKLLDDAPFHDSFALKDSSTGGVVNLFSTSNLNTPNELSHKSIKMDPQQKLRKPLSRESSGRMTLRSVHLTSTDEMKEHIKDGDMARIHESCFAPENQVELRLKF